MKGSDSRSPDRFEKLGASEPKGNGIPSMTIKEIEQKVGFLEQRLIKAKKREEKFIGDDI